MQIQVAGGNAKANRQALINIGITSNYPRDIIYITSSIKFSVLLTIYMHTRWRGRYKVITNDYVCDN